MVSQLCSRSGSAHFPRAADDFPRAGGPVVIAPPVALVMVLPLGQTARRPIPHVVFIVPWKSEPLI